MPSIIPCTNCIISVNVQNHTVRKDNLSVKWQRECAINAFVNQIIESFHRSDGSYSLKRAEVFACVDPLEKVIKALWWGYPNGMRSHFHEVMQCMGDIAGLLGPHTNQHLNIQDFTTLFDRLYAIPYVGHATISKLLYFFGIYQDDTQCVIVDRFVRESMAYYDEFLPVHTAQPVNWYLEHARQINNLNINGATPEQIEYFLFCHRVN